ncbi:unnamed protein product, partial [Ectocarpus sp. 8 AP-2014]
DKVDLNRTAGQGTQSGVIGHNISPASQSQGHGLASHQGAHGVDTPGPVREATAGGGSATRGPSWRRSSRRLYCTPRTTSPPTRSTRLANTKASCARARGRRGRGAGFPTADTAPPTPGHIPREFLVLHAAV